MAIEAAGGSGSMTPQFVSFPLGAEVVRPQLTIIEGGGNQSNRPVSLEQLDRFFVSRQLAEASPGVRDDRLDHIREDVRSWFADNYPGIAGGKPGNINDYNGVSKKSSDTMLGQLLGYLADNHVGENGMSFAELFSSQDFLAANTALNQDLDQGRNLSEGVGSHAFVVPVRLSTGHPEYSREIRPLVHAFHYVPDDLIPHFMRDFPTFVADRYDDGGFVIVAPVTDDMRRDLSARSLSEFFNAARCKVNRAIDLGYALGALEFGYGATFPGLMGLGEHTHNQEVETTTGHGETTALMVMLIEQIINEKLRHKEGVRIGVIGLGQIGLPAAEVTSDFYPNSEIRVFDTRQQRINKLLEGPLGGRFRAAQDVAEVIRSCDIILSTATTTFDFSNPDDPNYIPVETLEGKYFIDDSEPHSLHPEQVIALGGIVLDVIGRDYSGKVVRRLSDFGYGHTLADGRLDAFGCEIEVALLSFMRREREAQGDTPEQAREYVKRFALRHPVTANDTRTWIALSKQYGIGPAPLQAFGKQY